MSGFSAPWLDLREGYDRAARSDALMRRFVSLLPQRPRLVDLGAGSGGNVRALAPLLPPDARWRLVDDDAALLALAASRCGAVACERRDLADDLAAAIGDAERSPPRPSPTWCRAPGSTGCSRSRRGAAHRC